MRAPPRIVAKPDVEVAAHSTGGDIGQAEAIADDELLLARPSHQRVAHAIHHHFHLAREQAGVDVLRQHGGRGILRLDPLQDETGRRGLVVAPINIELAEHVYDLRAALDATAAAPAAERATGRERRLGKKILLSGRRAVADRDIPAMIQADFYFHCYIYESSGNPLIESVATMNWHHVRRVATALSSRLLSLAPLWQEREDILSAVVAGNASDAATLARSHVESSMRKLKSFGSDAFAPSLRPDERFAFTQA